MVHVLHILLTLAVSALAGLLLQRLKVPAGMMIGALAAAAALTGTFHLGEMPEAAKTVSQLIAGVLIGCSTGREDLRQLKTLYKPVLTVIGALLLGNLVMGALLCAAGYSDLLTCLVCAIPGGIADVTLIAVDLGANPSKVLLVHFCRLVAGVALFPLLIPHLAPPVEQETAPSLRGEPPAPPRPAPHNGPRLLVYFVLGWAASLLGNALHVPAATILFSLISSLALNLCGFSVSLPNALRRLAQVLSGAYIGCLLDPDLFGGPLTILSAVGITVVVLLANAYVFGRWMRRFLGIPLREGMLMLTPAGASDMALISADIGVVSPRLVLVQIFRLLAAIALFPQICLAVWRLVG